MKPENGRQKAPSLHRPGRLSRLLDAARFVISGQPVSAVDINERTFLFGCRILELSERLQKAGGVPRQVAPQLLRSGTSIGANLEEAVGGQTKPDFIMKVCIALKEAREAKYWLRLLHVRHLLKDENLAPDIQEADEIIAILTAIVKRARASPARGII
jgi:four helix bundle protein